MSTADRGPVLIVDATCLFEVVTRTPLGDRIRRRLAEDEQAAPHIIDVEVFGVVRRELRLGEIDLTTAELALEDLVAWPGTRFDHRPLLRRAWELRDNVRGWDAMYVALAELLDGVLITGDAPLAAAPGPRCPIELFAAG